MTIREIILDTETTGLDPANGDRVIEIGAVELINHVPSGQTFHRYVNPERDVPADAVAVHGLTAKFLEGHPTFDKVVNDFLAFIGDSTLVIHNADFDVGFLNAEMAYLDLPPILPGRVKDSLKLARQKFPMGPNSLDALCKRFQIDNTKRTKHGALLDSELLAAVYLELIGGRQAAFSLASAGTGRTSLVTTITAAAPQRPSPLPSRLTEAERQAHAQHIAALGSHTLWTELA